MLFNEPNDDGVVVSSISVVDSVLFFLARNGPDRVGPNMVPEENAKRLLIKKFKLTSNFLKVYSENFAL